MEYFLDILKARDAKNSFVRTLIEFMRPATVEALKNCDEDGLLNIQDSIEIASQSGTSFVVKLGDIVYVPSEDRTIFLVSEVIASFNAFCLLKENGTVEFIGNEEDFWGVHGDTFMKENSEILEVFATLHSFCLVKWNKVIFLGNPCFGGLYRSKKKKGKFSRSVTYCGGIIDCCVTGKFNNRFKIQYNSTRSTGGSHEVGCAKQCKGGHLKSFYD